VIILMVVVALFILRLILSNNRYGDYTILPKAVYIYDCVLSRLKLLILTIPSYTKL
jgi:hypothetical protein